MSHRTDRGIAAGLLALALTIPLLAGCARAGRPTVPTAGAPSPSPCGTPAHPGRITDADNGRTLCLAVGDHLDVFLSSTPERKWAPITLDGSGLAARPSGVGALAIGVTGAFYVGTAPGTAHLDSQRLACVDPGPSCGPATFTVTVIVR